MNPTKYPAAQVNQCQWICSWVSGLIGGVSKFQLHVISFKSTMTPSARNPTAIHPDKQEYINSPVYQDPGVPTTYCYVLSKWLHLWCHLVKLAQIVKWINRTMFACISISGYSKCGRPKSWWRLLVHFINLWFTCARAVLKSNSKKQQLVVCRKAKEEFNQS